MNALALNVWADLRQKRLVPVAAVMVGALIAIPLLLIKPAEEPPAPVPDAASASSKQLEPIGSAALVKPVEQSIESGSALDRFLSKDPFKPVQSLEDEADVVAETTDSSGAEGGSSGGGEEASGGAGGDTGGSTGGGTGGGAPESTEPAKPAPQKYTYVLDVTFTSGEKSRSIKRLERLQILPNESQPLLVFLGVTSSGNEAGFIVDSGLTPVGEEGRCKPSPSECGFIYLEAGEEHGFTDSLGNEYKLRIDQIRKVTVESLARTSAARKKKAVASRDESPLVRTAEGPIQQPRRIFLPFLSDFEIEFRGQE